MSAFALTVALAIALALLGAETAAAAFSCSTASELASWPCNICDAVSNDKTLFPTCQTCVKGSTNADVWKCQTCANTQVAQKANCFTCAGSVPIDKFWGCQTCQAATSFNKCLKCITPGTEPWKCAICNPAAEDSQCYDCVTQAPDAQACSACAQAQDAGACYTCLTTKTPSNTFIPASSCAVCHGVADKAKRDACYVCAQSNLPEWYCRSLVQTPGCFANAPTNTLPPATPDPTTGGCLNCMAATDGNTVTACLNCAGLATPVDKQACMNCVAVTKASGGLAYSCATATTAAQLFRTCVSRYYSADMISACSQCASSQPTQQLVDDCAACVKVGLPPTCPVKEVAWTLRSAISFSSAGNPKIGTALRFKWTEALPSPATGFFPHNVYEVTSLTSTAAGLSASDCTATSNQVLITGAKRGSPDHPAYSRPLLLNDQGKRYFICIVGQHCNPTSPSLPMRFTITTEPAPALP